MTYLVDGYNVLLSNPKRFAAGGAGSGDQLGAACAGFARAVERFCERRKCSAVIVFDGNPHGSPESSRYVRIVYSGEARTADDLLVAMVEEDPGRRDLKLVSSDRRLAACARANHVPCTPAEAFLGLLAPGGSPPAHSGRAGREARRDRSLGPEEVDYWRREFGL